MAGIPPHSQHHLLLLSLSRSGKKCSDAKPQLRRSFFLDSNFFDIFPLIEAVSHANGAICRSFNTRDSCFFLQDARRCPVRNAEENNRKARRSAVRVKRIKRRKCEANRRRANCKRWPPDSSSSWTPRPVSSRLASTAYARYDLFCHSLQVLARPVICAPEKVAFSVSNAPAVSPFK